MSINSDVHWKISTVESVRSYSNITITGQFPVTEDGVTWELNSSVPDVGAMGHAHPIIQWVKNEIEEISLSIVLFSRHRDEDIMPRFKNLKKLRDRDNLLRRAPICRFTYGSIISMLCQVRSLGGVKIERPTQNGRARRIDLSLTLVRYEPYKIKEVDSTKPQKESLYHTVGRHEQSWEMLAVKTYGPEMALYGDRLRKRNKSQAFSAEIGTEVKIPNREIIIRELIEPEWHGFKRGDETAEQMVLDKFIARNDHYLVRNRR